MRYTMVIVFVLIVLGVIVLFNVEKDTAISRLISGKAIETDPLTDKITPDAVKTVIVIAAILLLILAIIGLVRGILDIKNRNVSEAQKYLKRFE